MTASSTAAPTAFDPPLFDDADAGERRRIVVFLDHDIIIRHFVNSGAFEALVAAHEVTFVAPPPPNRRVTIDLSADALVGPRLRHLAPNPDRHGLWTVVNRVRRARPSFDKHRLWLRKIALDGIDDRRLKWLVRMLSFPGIFGVWRRRQLDKITRLPYPDLDALLDDLKPDVVVHPSVFEGVYINDLSLACRERGLPFVLIMNSWDNPCTKSTAVIPPDWLLVWGDQTYAHALEYMNADPHKTIRFGAAQFDVYRAPPRIDRRAFCAEHGIAPEKILVLYAGSSKGSDEFRHLTMLDDAIDAGALGDAALVYRPHPWGGGGAGPARMLEPGWRHTAVERSMRAFLERAACGENEIFLADYERTRDVLNAVDIVITPLSTIAVEAMMLGKPAIVLLDEEEADTGGGMGHLRMAMSLKHFDVLYDSPYATIVRRAADLPAALRTELGRLGEPGRAEEIARSTETVVGRFDAPFRDRIVTFLEDVCAERTGGRSGADLAPIPSRA